MLKNFCANAAKTLEMLGLACHKSTWLKQVLVANGMINSSIYRKNKDRSIFLKFKFSIDSFVFNFLLHCLGKFGLSEKPEKILVYPDVLLKKIT